MNDTALDKNKLDVVRKVINELALNNCTVWDAEEILSYAMRVIRATATVQGARHLPYQLPPRVNL